MLQVNLIDRYLSRHKCSLICAANNSHAACSVGLNEVTSLFPPSTKMFVSWRLMYTAWILPLQKACLHSQETSFFSQCFQPPRLKPFQVHYVRFAWIVSTTGSSPVAFTTPAILFYVFLVTCGIEVSDGQDLAYIQGSPEELGDGITERPLKAGLLIPLIVGVTTLSFSLASTNYRVSTEMENMSCTDFFVSEDKSGETFIIRASASGWLLQVTSGFKAWLFTAWRVKIRSVFMYLVFLVW